MRSSAGSWSAIQFFKQVADEYPPYEAQQQAAIATQGMYTIPCIHDFYHDMPCFALSHSTYHTMPLLDFSVSSTGSLIYEPNPSPSTLNKGRSRCAAWQVLPLPCPRRHHKTMWRSILSGHQCNSCKLIDDNGAVASTVIAYSKWKNWCTIYACLHGFTCQYCVLMLPRALIFFL